MPGLLPKIDLAQNILVLPTEIAKLQKMWKAAANRLA
jgi:hypothetical protein